LLHWQDYEKRTLALAKGQDRVLLVMATGTGKTYVAAQIIWRLWKPPARTSSTPPSANWLRQTECKPKAQEYHSQPCRAEQSQHPAFQSPVHPQDLGFSKKLHNHRCSVALLIAHFNFCGVHRTIKQTPAMAAGLTDHVWTAEELLES